MFPFALSSAGTLSAIIIHLGESIDFERNKFMRHTILKNSVLSVFAAAAFFARAEAPMAGS